MKKSELAGFTKIISFICGLALLFVLFTPMWRIDLQAPQYPEGLRMLIYADKLAGNVDIINGLNHYIGMKTLHSDDFPEFKILPGIIVFFSIFFMAVAILGKRKWLNLLFILFVLLPLSRSFIICSFFQDLHFIRPTQKMFHKHILYL